MERLTARRAETLRKPGWYRAGDTVYLVVAKGRTGRVNKRWVQRLHVQGKRRDISIGTYPAVTLSEARERAHDNRLTAKRGGDPSGRASTVPTFADVSAGVDQGGQWRGRTRETRRRTLARYAARLMGRPVDQIDRAAVLSVLGPVYRDKPATGKLLRGWVRGVLAAAQALGHVDVNAAGEVIDAALPKTPKTREHRRALPYADVPAALEAVEASGAGPAVEAALRFTVLTAVRSGEARGATWGEVDLEAREWRVPASRMKAGAEHRVPLSDAAVAVLESMKAHSDGAADSLIFPGVGGRRPLNGDTLIKALRRATGTDADVHGFRSSFRTWAAERSGATRDVAEMALAHVVGGAVERSYARSDLFDQRRGLMDRWAAFVTGPGAGVTPPATQPQGSGQRARRARVSRPQDEKFAPDRWSSPMDALTLKELYESQLREELKRPPTPDLNRREMSCMLRVSRSMTPGALVGHDPARTWVWSDLHLGHTKTIEVFQRPFGTADEMNDTIFRAWEQAVAPADTILILGDVTVDGLWGRRIERVRQAPGRKILVYGNHEITSTGLVETNGFDEVHSSLYVEGDPPLLLTHVPLRVIPKDCVNIHGHLHHTHVPGKTRHINVCVEQLQYRPRALSALRRLAQRLVKGVTVRGRTTGDKLDWID